MEITGKIKQIGETKTFGAKGFRKREFVVTTDEKFPQHIPLECVQDKVDLLDKFSVGQFIKVGVNIQGREWINKEGEAKHFLSLQAWSINLLEGGVPDGAFEKADSLNEDDPDDLPF
jgi:hypothetical protein